MFFFLFCLFLSSPHRQHSSPYHLPFAFFHHPSSSLYPFLHSTRPTGRHDMTRHDFFPFFFFIFEACTLTYRNTPFFLVLQHSHNFSILAWYIYSCNQTHTSSRFFSLYTLLLASLTAADIRCCIISISFLFLGYCSCTGLFMVMT